MSDLFTRSIHHRSSSTDDTPLYTLAERTRLLGLQAAGYNPNRQNGLLLPLGASDIELGFVGLGNDNGTILATIVGIPPILERLPESQAPYGPYLIRLGVLTITFGTTTFDANKNPVDGTALAASTWRAADTIVATVEGTGIKLWDAGGVNGIARAVFDPLQCAAGCFVYISSRTNMTQIDVIARHVDKYR